MGRPRDEFSWKQVEVSNDGWKCKFCREDFKGSASRIRNHLSGEGNDISACAAVPEQIRNEALKKVTRKRGRSLQISSSSSTTSLCQGPSPSSINDDPIAFTKMASEEYVTDAFIKFLMCGKFSSVGSQVLKDPFFREYLERTNRHGVPLSLLQDNSFVIEKSVFKIKHELNQYMLRVAESWKKTGCTLMKFNLNQEKKGKFSSNLEKDMYAIAIYCPKGIIFMETSHLMGNYEDYYYALEKHSPSLRIDGAPYRWMFHGPKYNGLGEDHLCDLNDEMTIGWTYTDTGLTDFGPVDECYRCLRHEIKGFCIDICSRSEWARRLFKKAVGIHENLCRYSFVSWYQEILKKKGLRFNLFVDTHASRLSIFLSIMMLEDEVKEKVLYQLQSQYRNYFHPQADHLEAILNDSGFWRSGSILKEVITMTWKTPDVMDTLVPTAGYLAMDIDRLKGEIVRKYVPKMVEEEFRFWQEIESKLSGITKRIDIASYLNPVYFLQQDVQKHPELLEYVKDRVKECCEGYIEEEEEEWEKLEGEVGRYGDVFRSLESAGIRLADYHPVILWEKYGHELPLLRKWAIRVLSQPVSCMCNQVKKHVCQLQGADDFILRLNVRMMEEFKLLGDNIYNPIECHLGRLSGNIYEHTT